MRAPNKAAEKKAMKLLKKHCTKKQWRHLKERGYMKVTCSDGVVRWLAMGAVENVHSPHTDPRRTYCATLNDKRFGWFPMGDHMLAQKLRMENDWPGFKAVAKVTAETTKSFIAESLRDRDRYFG